MRNLFIILLFTFTIQHVNAQQFEPKWTGMACAIEVVEADTVAIPLEKTIAQIKDSYLLNALTDGMANAKSSCTIQGAKSSVQLKPNQPVTLLVRCKDNESDPFSFIQVVKFSSKKKERRAELAKGNFIKTTQNNMNFIPFEAESYGKSSYILTLPPLEGEYGVRILNPDAVDEKAPVFHCFGVN